MSETITKDSAVADNKILAKKDGPIGHLVFNNPEKRNAFSLEMSLAAADVLDDFLADDAIRVIVLSGAGDKAFVSGGDISNFEKARATKEQVENYTKTGERFRTLLKGSAKRRSR
jgi:enoyl-CoA hydratase